MQDKGGLWTQCGMASYNSFPRLKTEEEEIASELVCPLVRVLTRANMSVLIVG